MKFRQRVITSVLWLGVALAMAITLEPGVPSTLNQLARLFVVVLAVFLAAVYLLDPRGMISEKPFSNGDN